MFDFTHLNVRTCLALCERTSMVRFSSRSSPPPTVSSSGVRVTNASLRPKRREDSAATPVGRVPLVVVADAAAAVVAGPGPTAVSSQLRRLSTLSRWRCRSRRYWTGREKNIFSLLAIGHKYFINNLKSFHYPFSLKFHLAN
jgi:hypothetical protein